MFSFLSLIFLPGSCAQNTTGVHVSNRDFDQRLSRMLKFDVPVISVDSFYHNKKKFFILDTRSPAEFQVSHISGAEFLNYNHPEYAVLKDMPKDQSIVLYCSVGYRSEIIGRKLMAMGYEKVYNLYGSIFEWVNKGYPIVNSENEITDSLNTYNGRWSQYVSKPGIIKLW